MNQPQEQYCFPASPLAEGRELKCLCIKTVYNELLSPLAEGRELKYGGEDVTVYPHKGRPSRRGVN